MDSRRRLGPGLRRQPRRESRGAAVGAESTRTSRCRLRGGRRSIRCRVAAAGCGAVRRRGAPGRCPGLDRRPGRSRRRASARALRLLRGRGDVLLRRAGAPGRRRGPARAVHGRAARRRHRHVGRAHTRPTAPRPATARPLLVAVARPCSEQLAEVELRPHRGAGRSIGRARRTTCSSSTGRCSGRTHLPRALGYIKSHRSDVPAARAARDGRPARAGQRTPVFRSARLGPVHLVPAAAVRPAARRGRAWSGSRRRRPRRARR